MVCRVQVSALGTDMWYHVVHCDILRSGGGEVPFIRFHLPEHYPFQPLLHCVLAILAIASR
jgi:hypothetical protein